MNRIYLDDNGSSPASAAALEKVRESLPLVGNPSSFHEHGRVLRALLDESRHNIATALRARDKDLIFCSGASEANRLSIDALVLWSRTLKRPLKILISPFEHPSLYKPAIEAAKDGYFLLDFINLSPEGKLNIQKEALINLDVLICCQAHNESGIIPDLKAILEKIESKTLVMSDASQGFARLEALSERVDIITCSAQKMGGLSGSGALVLRNNAKILKAPWPGPGQERGFRPGTEASLLILAFGAAAKEVEERRKSYISQTLVRDSFEESLVKKTKAFVVGQGLPRLSNTSAVCFPDKDKDALRIACDLAALSVGFGSACSGLAPEGSLGLEALGLSLQEQMTTVRFSFPPFSLEALAHEAVERLSEFVFK